MGACAPLATKYLERNSYSPHEPHSDVLCVAGRGGNHTDTIRYAVMVSSRFLSVFLFIGPAAHGYSFKPFRSYRQQNVAADVPFVGLGTTESSSSAASVPCTALENAPACRRSFFRTALTAFGASFVVASKPVAALAAGEDAFEKKQLMPLDTYLYTIARVKEATQQEMRLIRTGKFKDVARGNVKLAVRFMLNNYRLSDNVIAASSYLKGQQQIQAGSDGQKAVQALYTILEYFDASGVENIKARRLIRLCWFLFFGRCWFSVLESFSISFIFLLIFFS